MSDETSPPATTAPTSTLTGELKRRPVVWLVALGVAIVLAGAVTIVYLLVAPGTITVNGTLDLTNTKAAKNSCVTQGGFSDIGRGTRVIVTDGEGKTLALGSLTGGRLTSTPDVCRYEFIVGKVPGNHDFYGIEVSHRGRVQFPRSALDGTVDLTLG